MRVCVFAAGGNIIAVSVMAKGEVKTRPTDASVEEFVERADENAGRCFAGA